MLIVALHVLPDLSLPESKVDKSAHFQYFRCKQMHPAKT